MQNKQPPPDLSPPPDAVPVPAASPATSSAFPDAGAHSSATVPEPKIRDMLQGNDFAANISRAKGGAEWSEASVFLRDLIAYFNVAAKKGREFVWTGWQPGGAGSNPVVSRRSSGSMCCSMSKKMAMKLQADWAVPLEVLKQPDHCDLVLKRYFSENPDIFCYLTPPLGGYTSHISGCAVEYFTKPRPDIWGEEWACTGTREEHDWAPTPREKWFCTFTKKGKCQFLSKVTVQIPDEKAMWKSFDNRVPQIASPPPQVEAETLSASWWQTSWWQQEQDSKWTKEESGRHKRARRQNAFRDKLRCWVENKEEATTKHIMTRLLCLCEAKFMSQALTCKTGAPWASRFEFSEQCPN